MSGLAATISLTSARMRAISPPAQWTSSFAVSPSTQLRSWRPARKASKRPWPSGSSPLTPINTAMRRGRPAPCANPADGQAAAAPPSMTIKRRRLIRSPRQRGSWCHCAGRPCRPIHSMTTSARARNVGEIVRPSAFAVFILISSSNFVGCSTGSCAGLAPFRILSTMEAARR